MLSLAGFTTIGDVAAGYKTWALVRDRLQAEEMPPEDAPAHPSAEERQAVIDWIKQLHDFEATRNAGDPGIVLARRLSNAEYDYTIHDLTGVDLRPTREFPVDPANEAGFDNSGESLTMSPSLAKKYLAAARTVADHVVFLPDGLRFAPHPVVTETDRDKYCVLRIVDFYRRHEVDLADYFFASWQYGHRAELGQADKSLDGFATEAGLSPKYLAQVAALLTGAEHNDGPVALIRSQWRKLPLGRTGSPSDSSANSRDGRTTSPSCNAAARAGCEHLRDLVLRLRAEIPTRTGKVAVDGISDGSQPLVLWGNRQRAARRLTYTGDVAEDLPKLSKVAAEAVPEAADLLALDESDDAVAHMRESLQAICGTFPDTFCVIERGPYFAPKEKSQQRLLTAGFHLMQGYFRDDRPLYELVLDEEARREIDTLWDELDLITDVPPRQYKDFIFFERAEPPRFMREAEFDFARSEDKDAISADKMERLRDAYLAKAVRKGAGDEAEEAIRTYFTDMSARIRWVEKTRAAAETSQFAALVDFAQRAWRRPLQAAERDDLLAYYRSLRADEGLSHEDAVRDVLATVLLSPRFIYRYDLVAPGPEVRPLTDYELASRLSYFVWASMPDDELLARAAAGDLHQPEVLAAQARRMLRDPRVRGLATEFFGNLLDIRRFEEHNAVDRERFPVFTNELRHAMFEEPLRYFIDLAQNNRSILNLIDGRHTFVNPVLAAHYGMPKSPFAPRKDASEAANREGTSFRGAKDDSDVWSRIDDATQYGRGGLLPMAVFLTKNSPGLRTSPVKRGYWVVRRLLDEHIPPPPPTVPELPKSETDLGELTLAQTLARHRADKACAGCHQRFDSIGLVFEDYGPIGECRNVDLGGRAVETGATFPDGKERHGVDGLREYIREQRQADFVNCFTGKLFAYALGRTLLPSDEPTLREMQTRMSATGYTFDGLVESIVTSPQFLRKRGGAAP